MMDKKRVSIKSKPLRVKVGSKQNMLPIEEIRAGANSSLSKRDPESYNLPLKKITRKHKMREVANIY